MFRSTLILALLLPSAAFDLDVGVPEGNPLDFVRAPVRTPSRDVETPGRDDDGPGETTTGEELAKPFPTLSRPLTMDLWGHLRWPRPTWAGSGTPTPRSDGLKGYPPVPSNSTYVSCFAYAMMVWLHPAQVSEAEIVSYLIEIGEPAGFALTAANNEPSLRDLIKRVGNATGPVPRKSPGIRGLSEFERRVMVDLISSFPYEAKFGKDLIRLPVDTALPVLLKFAKSRHSFLQRNAVFALRSYDDKRVLPVLREALKSKDKVVRNRALSALVRWRDVEIVPFLAKAMRGSDRDFRAYATFALGKIGGRDAMNALMAATRPRRSDTTFLWTAIPALGEVGIPEKKVIQLLESLKKTVSRVTNPPQSQYQLDKSGVRRRILEERVMLALAMLRDKDAEEWLKTVTVHTVNLSLYRKLKFRDGPPVKTRDELTPWLHEELKKLRDRLRNKEIDSTEYRSQYMALMSTYRYFLERLPYKVIRRPKPEPKPKPEPRPKPEPEGESPDSVFKRHRERLEQYEGVALVELRDGAIHISAVSEADAADLRMLLGPKLDGVDLEITP